MVAKDMIDHCRVIQMNPSILHQSASNHSWPSKGKMMGKCLWFFSIKFALDDMYLGIGTLFI